MSRAPAPVPRTPRSRPTGRFAVAVLLVILVWVLLGMLTWSLAARTGHTAAAESTRTGTATIEHCSPSILHLALVQDCDATITWHSETTETDLQEGPDYRIRSPHPLSGTVDVSGHMQWWSGGRSGEVIRPTSDPAHGPWLGLLAVVVAPIVVLAGGGTLAYRATTARQRRRTD